MVFVRREDGNRTSHKTETVSAAHGRDAGFCSGFGERARSFGASQRSRDNLERAGSNQLREAGRPRSHAGLIGAVGVSFARVGWDQFTRKIYWRARGSKIFF